MNKQRKHHRFSCDIEVDILSSALENYPSIACDISEGGIFLVVPFSSVLNLNSDGIDLKNGESIQIAIPDYHLTAVYFFTCLVKHFTVVSGIEIMVGLEFMEKTMCGKKFIVDYVSQIK